MRVLEARSAFNGAFRFDVRNNGIDLGLVVSETTEAHWYAAVSERHVAAANELLERDNAEHWFDARRIAIHHEAYRAGRRQHGDLCVAEAVGLCGKKGAVPETRCNRCQ